MMRRLFLTLCLLTLPASVSAQTPKLGELRVVAIRFNWQNDLRTPPSVSSGQTALAATDRLFREASGGKMWLTYAILGPVTLPMDRVSCNPFVWANAAVTALGSSVPAHDRLMFAFPVVSECKWNGLAAGSTWINGTWSVHTTAHELGHNLTLGHAASLPCRTTTSGALSCVTSTYGSTVDVMNASGVGHFNAISKRRLGWLTDAEMPLITTTGTYRLGPFETGGDPTLPRAIRIGTGAAERTVEVRTHQTAFTTPVGVTLHKALSVQMDTDHVTTTFRAMLPVGVDYREPGWTLRVRRVGVWGADVSVMFNGDPLPADLYPPDSPVSPPCTTSTQIIDASEAVWRVNGNWNITRNGVSMTRSSSTVYKALMWTGDTLYANSQRGWQRYIPTGTTAATRWTVPTTTAPTCKG